jgi:alkyl hydroperoxide reductase subunit AhpF
MAWYNEGMNQLPVSHPIHLDVYLSAHCLQCPDARALAQEMARKFPALVVRITDLDGTGAQPPAAVFAVPTFLLDGKIVSLGTPYREDLVREIRLALKASKDLVHDEYAHHQPRKNRLPAKE